MDTGGNLNGSGIVVNGQSDCAGVGTVVGMPNCMANGNTWSVWIDYDGTNLRVALAENSLVRPADIINQAVNIPSLLGATSAYVGFTAATGAGFENHDILNWRLAQRFAPIDPTQPDVPEPSTGILAGTAAAVLGLAYRRWRTA